MDDEVEVAVIGAGASGLSASRVLSNAGVAHLVLEARDRIGGRAFTLTHDRMALDLGCGWLHSADRNLFAQAAPGLGFDLDRTAPPWTRQAGNRGFSREDQAAFGQALEDLEGRIEQAAAEGRDVAVSTLMEPSGRFNPLLDAFSSYYNGAEFDQISTVDYDAYQDSNVNWRAPAGYGALIAAYGAGAPVRMGAAVTHVDHAGPRVKVTTDKGDLHARAVIVTLPTDLIAAETIAFRPALPDLLEAAAGLPLGLADKVFLRMDDPASFPEEDHLFGDPRRTATGSYHLRPFGRPLIETYLGGANARALEGQGKGAAAAFAIEELAGLLGSRVRACLSPVAASAWAADPWVRGAYSHARPGCAWARAELARPFADRIFIAGEAASPDAFSTAHGAAEAGARAARQVLEVLV